MKYVQITPEIYPSEESSKKKILHAAKISHTEFI